MAHATIERRTARSLLATPTPPASPKTPWSNPWISAPDSGHLALLDAPQHLHTPSPFLQPLMGDYDEDDEDDDFFDDDTEGGGDEAAEEDDDFLDDEEEADVDEDEGSDDDDDDL